VEVTDDAVLIQLLFPNLAASYRKKDAAAAAPKQPAPAVTAPSAAPSSAPARPDPTPSPPPAPATTTAEFEVEVEGEVFKVRVTGAGMAVTPVAASAAPQAAPVPRSGAGTVIAPMQGLIVKIPIRAGDDVKLGDVVAVLEAMKMQNDIVTNVAGKVRDIYVKEGEVVTPNQPLLAIG
jgi:biotin carboxyl carrier protein